MEQFEYLAYGKGNISFDTLPPLAQKLQILIMTTGMMPNRLKDILLKGLDEQ